MNKVVSILVCVVMIIVGCGCIFFGIRNAKLCTEEVNATVIDNKYIESATDSRHSSGAWYPVFSYTYQGHPYQQQASEGTGNIKYQKGEVVTIKINPDDPGMIMMPGINMLIVCGVIFILFGAGFLVGIINGKVSYGRRRHY